MPLSLCFAWIVTITFLIKNNELVSFYSLGISHKNILSPIIAISTLITFVLIALQATPLAYSYEQKQRILKNQYFVSEQSNIFLKYNEYFIYFEKLYPLEKKATNIHIFKTRNNDIIETIVGKKAYYQNNKWYVLDTTITRKPKQIDWIDSKLNVTYEKFLYTLEGFEPKIINNVYKANVQFSTIDAIYTILLLNKQNFNTNKIKTILYSQIFTPFFILPIIILVFMFSSANNRFFNTAKFISSAIFFTLFIWGVMFLLQRLALGSIILAEIAVFVPLILLFMVTYYLYNKRVD